MESGALILPLEVLGPDQSEVSIDVVDSDSPDATHMYLRVHALGYDGKASVRVNGGSWLSISNRNVTFPLATERAQWAIGGPAPVLKMIVPLTNWPAITGPTNTFSFKFNDLNGKTIGYRVLEFDLLDGETRLLPPDYFDYDDPADWDPPSTNPADIAAGSDAFFNATITEPLRPTMLAKCQDCHVDGRDLKYFNFSTKSIVERSVFHGLTREVGTNIASYILSLPIPYEENGRPWNPPYQPGPGMDALPVRSWAAGAGIDAVLTNDLATLNYIWPGGDYAAITGFSTNAHNYRTNVVNAREIPLAMQFPDILHWWPEVHPLDAYDFYATNGTDPDNSYNYYTFFKYLTNLLVGKSGLEAITIIDSQVSNWDGYSSWGGPGNPQPAKSATNYWQWEDNHRSIVHWRNSMMWRLMTGMALEEYGVETEGAQSTDRRWPHGEIFNTGEHRLGYPNTSEGVKDFATRSAQWYQVQLVLNDANRRGGTIVPIDWGYQHDLLNSAWSNLGGPTTNWAAGSLVNGMPWYGITILNMVKGHEAVSNGLGLTNVHGWKPGNGKIVNVAPGNTRTNGYKQIDLALRVKVAEAVVVPWLEECESWTYAQYAAEFDKDGNGELKTSLRDLIKNLASGIKGIGVQAAIVNRVCDFGELLFPAFNWDPYRA